MKHSRHTEQNIQQHLASKDNAAQLLSRSFGTEHHNMPPAIDKVLSAKLREAFEMLDEDLLVGCFQRGILPESAIESIRTAVFLSYTLPSARAAQVSTGVPASFLCGQAFMISGGDPSAPGFDIFRTGKTFRSITEAFLSYADELITQPGMDALIASSLNPDQYTKAIEAWSAEHNDGLAEEIRARGLADCDHLHGLGN